MASPPLPDFSQLLAGVSRALTLGADPSHLPSVLDLCRELRLEVLPENPAGFVAETFVLPVRDPDTGNSGAIDPARTFPLRFPRSHDRVMEFTLNRCSRS